MSSAALTSPPAAMARLVVDTDVASFVFKWHPDFAPRYVGIIRGAELVVSFMTVAEMLQGAMDSNWGPRKCDLLEAYLADFSVLHSDDLLCSTWAAVRNESIRKGRQISAADAWIAATALILSAPLVTNNPKDYRHLERVQLVSAEQNSTRLNRSAGGAHSHHPRSSCSCSSRGYRDFSSGCASARRIRSSSSFLRLLSRRRGSL